MHALDCDLCRQNMPIYWLPNEVWQKLPKSLHKRIICINCFKKICPEKP